MRYFKIYQQKKSKHHVNSPTIKLIKVVLFIMVTYGSEALVVS